MSIRPDGAVRRFFYGRTQDQVRKMIAGASNDSVYTCDECIELCSEILEEELGGQGDASSPSLADTRLLEPKEIESSLDEYITGQDKARKALSMAVYNHYKKVTSYQNMNVDIQRSNILVVGPIGSGKTCLAQTLAKILNVPFAIVDAMTLTEAGYTDEDVENILLEPIQSTDYNTSCAGYGIMYIDEIDKITRRSENVSITRGVSGEDVQQAPLKILEGTVASVPPQGGRKHPHQELLQTDTTSTSFIRGGALDGLERIVGQCLSADSIGFNVEVVNRGNVNIDDLLRKVEPKDLTKFGLIPEFIDRVPVTVSLQQPIKDAMVRILSEPGNVPTRQYQKLFELNNIKPEFTREALEEITQLAVDRKVGARGLRSILESMIMDLMYETPPNDTIGICTITREVVEETGQPELVYRDMPPASVRKSLSDRMRGDNKTGEVA